MRGITSYLLQGIIIALPLEFLSVAEYTTTIYIYYEVEDRSARGRYALND
jgi:hypothetical protein